MLSNKACNSSKVKTESIYFFCSSCKNSAFLAVQGPIKITFDVGSVSLMYLAISAAGDKLWEMWSTSLGKLFLIYITKAGQQELVKNPFSTNSFDSL